jgi:UDP-2-acetamido-3-amino-2,3-dideoxy-glucuronate N-acetyltransferase
LLKLKFKNKNMKEVKIHPTAQVQDGAKIGKGSAVWNNSQVLAGAKIGENCTIGHNCAVYGGAKLGNGVKIECNTDVWELVYLENDVFVGPSAVFTNDPNPRAKFPKKKFPQYGKWLPTIIKEGASLGANSTIVCGKKVGKWAFIGAGSVVTKDIPDYALAVGVPARQIAWVCECGNKLDFQKEKTTCKICKKTYTKKGNKVKRIK